MAETLLSAIKIEEFLLKGEKFSKRQEGISTSGNSTSVQTCVLRLDDEGFFLLWNFRTQKETNILECTQIKEVTTGINLKDGKSTFELGDSQNSVSPRVLSIYHGFEIGALSLLQFVASSSEIAEKWANGINRVIYCWQYRFLTPLDIVKKQWRRLQYSVSSKGTISVRRLLKHFGNDKNEKAILQKLNNCGFSCSKNEEINPTDLSFEVFEEIHTKICVRKDLEDLFKKVAGAKADYIEMGSLKTWLNENQRDPRLNEILAPPFDDKATTAIIQNYEKNKKNKENRRLSYQGFSNYLASKHNSLVNLDHIRLSQDMDQPLSHYFVYSSHNTYLTGRQWRGKSSVDIYRHVLIAGCRCIELDCWDGSQGEPIITHGKAMCTDVPFKDVLCAIRDAAFVTSEYPLILSFETHCSKPQQLKMAKYCEEVFGDLLLNKPLEANPLEQGVPLPSPNALKRKILIKNKRLDPEVEKAELENLSRNKGDSVLEEETEEAHPEAHPEAECAGSEPQADDQSISKNPSSVTLEEDMKPTSNHRSVVRSQSSVDTAKPKVGKKGNVIDEEEQEFLSYEYTKTSFTNIHPYLSSIVNYCQSVKFSGFKKVEEDIGQKLCYQMSSFSESAGLNYLKTNAIEFVNYNRCQLSRIYPRGSRVDSSNYMPQLFWNAGCQLVSLNLQTYDLGVQLNSGKFDCNGRSGYLLKPEVLLTGSKNFDPFSESSFDGVIAAQCGVKIISAQCLSDRPISSYVEVDMYGLPNDTIRKEFRTNIAVANGLNPTYDDNKEFLFRKIICPDLALLRFTLHDDNRQLLGQRVIPLSCLQTGYRYVSLRNTSGVPLDSATIFVKITLKSYVPDDLLGFASALENPKAHLSLMDQREELLKCLEDDDEDDDGFPTELNNKKSIPNSNNNVSNDVIDEEAIKTNNNKPPVKTKSTKPAQNKEKVVKKSSSGNIHSSLYVKTEQKKILEDIIEQSSVTVEMLRNHPVYIRTIEKHKKQSVKLQKKQEKERRKSLKGENVSSALCCLASRRKDEKIRNSQEIDGQIAPALLASPVVSSNQKRNALLDALHAIHNEKVDQLKSIQEKEMADMMQNQTERSIEGSKRISKDKSILPAEKERRVRDLRAQNVKSFMEERTTLNNRHGKQKEKLLSAQKEAEDKIMKIVDAEELQ